MKTFNRWFDSLVEPTRFAVFLALILPAFVALVINRAGFACIWLFGLGLIRILPRTWKHPAHPEVLNERDRIGQ